MLKRFFLAVGMWLGFVGLMFCLPATFAASEKDFLPPEIAFQPSVTLHDAKTVEVHFKIAEGYYMYRERFHFKAEGVTLGEAIFPAGVVKYDPTFEKFLETYSNKVTIALPLTSAHTPFTLHVQSQGCAEEGICYPPMDTRFTVSADGSVRSADLHNANAASRPGSLGALISSLSQVSMAAVDQPVQPMVDQPATQALPDATEMGRIEASLHSGKLLAIVPLFFVLGLGLSFTPCVLPMVPILSSIIVGGHAAGSHSRPRRRAFVLSLSYVLGMTIIYTLLGVVAGLLGQGLSAALQNPWVLSLFALMLVAMALAMFGFYTFQLPSALQTRLSGATQHLSTGKVMGAFAMGGTSALIVGPCVAAPLAGALLYISQTGDALIGGSALFALSLGMGVPLLLVGVSAGSLLPRAGAWMESVKRFFGVLMLAVALWLIAPVMPSVFLMLGWAFLGIGVGAYMMWGHTKGAPWWGKSIGLCLMALGMLQLTGVATGGRDVLAPWAHLRSGHGSGISEHTRFIKVSSVSELETLLAQAQTHTDGKGKPFLLDFYADWCITCKEMEKFTFSDPRVQAAFKGWTLLQIDVTANNDDDKAMLKRFNLFGPPAIIFFDKNGREIPRPQGRVIGYQNAETFLKSLAATH